MQSTRDPRLFTRMALFTALLCISGYIMIPLPFSPVPVTAQTLVVILCGLLLPKRQALFAVTAYLLIGVTGIPVFAGGASGPGVLAGPTGGFLIGFPATALFIAHFRGHHPDCLRYSVVSALGSLVILNLMGVPWLAWSTGMNVSQAMAAGFWPFLPGGIVKLVAAVVIALRLEPHLSLGYHY